MFTSSFREAAVVSKGLPGKEKRRWTRLKLAIPVFVRTQSPDGKENLEFATAVNVSAGGALLIVRRSLNKAGGVLLEIPSAPIAPVHGLPESSRTIRAKAIWVKHLDDYHLMGLKFVQPLSTDAPSAKNRRLRRKSASAV
jgi:PilZ domain-containing protein